MSRELTMLERAYGMAEAAMAHAWAMEELFMEFVVQTKHPEGLPIEEWRQKMATLRERLDARAAELLPEVQLAMFGQIPDDPLGQPVEKEEGPGAHSTEDPR